VGSVKVTDWIEVLSGAKNFPLDGEEFINDPLTDFVKIG
jgi:hypothetical protein